MSDSNQTYLATLDSGLFGIWCDKERRVACAPWKSRSQIAFVDPRPVDAFSACLDAQGRLHVLLCTSSHHLVYAMTQDGNHFVRSTLSYSEDPTVEIMDPWVGVASQVMHVAYLIHDRNRMGEDIIVHYRKPIQGDWSGRRVATMPSDHHAQLMGLDTAGEGAFLLVQRTDGRQAVVMRYDLQKPGAAPQHILAAPLPFTDFQMISGTDRQYHTCWLSAGQVYLDGLPVSSTSLCCMPCLDIRDEKVICIWMEAGKGKQWVLRAEGWVPDAQPKLISPPLWYAVLTPRGVLRRAETEVQRTAPCQPAIPDVPVKSAADVPSTTELLRNHAYLLRQLEEQTRQQQQMYYELQAEVKRVMAQQATMRNLQDELRVMKYCITEMEQEVRKEHGSKP